jgi:hypothetical protein
MAGVEVGMGSESGDTFGPFFIVANHDEDVSDRIDEGLLRARFGGTLFPPATITVEPLEERGIWWSEVLDDASEMEEDEQEEYLRPWRALMRWFHEQPAFRDSAFVRIGDSRALSQLARNQWPVGTELCPGVLPRLTLGLTAQGSLVGLFGFSVQT